MESKKLKYNTVKSDDLTCDKIGRMVTPACPPMTGTFTSLGSTPITSACTILKFTQWYVETFRLMVWPNINNKGHVHRSQNEPKYIHIWFSQTCNLPHWISHLPKSLMVLQMESKGILQMQNPWDNKYGEGGQAGRHMRFTTNVFARTTSRVVTPNRRLGSYTPAIFSTSAAMGTVEFTGLLIILTIACGQCFATPSINVRTIPALILNKSSLVIPGFLGTPAGIITKSIPSSAGPSWSFPR